LEILSEYSTLKIALLLMSHGRELPQSISQYILENYGTLNLFELDKIVHELHKKIIELSKNQELPVNTSDDGLVIVGLLQKHGHRVIDADGNPYTGSLYILLENATVYLSFSSLNDQYTTVSIDYDVDSTLSLPEYYTRYLEKEVEEFEDIRASLDSIYAKNGLIYIKTMYHSAVEDAVEIVGADIVSHNGDKYIIRVHPRLVVNFIDILALLMLADEIGNGHIPSPAEITRSEVELSKTLQMLSGTIPCRMEYTEPLFSEVHEHWEDYRVDLHITGKIELSGRLEDVILSAIAVVSALDHNFEETSSREAVEDAVKI